MTRKKHSGDPLILAKMMARSRMKGEAGLDEVSAKESSEFSDYKEIIDVFSKLDKVDTKGIETNLQAIELKNMLRDDKVEKSFTQKDVLSLTDHKKDGYFKGPKAI